MWVSEQSDRIDQDADCVSKPQAPSVPGLPGTTVIWPALQATERAASFRATGGASRWHSDLVHERQPAG
jgi:hypothetical protein